MNASRHYLTDSAYWRDVGTPVAYWQAHLELLDDAPRMRLDDKGWPLPAACGQPALTRRYAGPGSRQSHRSLIAKGCKVEGVVNRSVLFPGVRIAGGTVIRDSVVLPGAIIGRNCRLSGAIVNRECSTPDGTVIGPSRHRIEGRNFDEPVIVTAEDFDSGSAPAYV
jgi:glucose-1-phosphate adenylyltransferase